MTSWLELDRVVSFLVGSLAVGPLVIYLVTRAGVAAGHADILEKVANLEEKLDRTAGEFQREIAGVWEHHKAVRGVALRAEKSVSDLTVRVSRLEGGGKG